MLSPVDTLARLPGVVCETRLPNLEPRPLRLDVAAFVGLAERGPLDVPVLIEDISQYRLIFGGDLPLARLEGRPLFAHLPPSVAAFFENGGRRCYVVRVAGAGRRANQFQVPGLLQDAGGGDWRPVVAPAAWAGRWSDLVSLAASLRLQPLQIRVDAPPLEIAGSALAAGSFLLPLRLPKPTALQPGDLLRLQLERMNGSFVPSMSEYFHFYGLDEKKLAYAKKDALVMHPGPMNRGVEIDSTVADGASSLIREQVEMGVAVRMAVLEALSRNLPNA